MCRLICPLLFAYGINRFSHDVAHLVRLVDCSSYDIFSSFGIDLRVDVGGVGGGAMETGHKSVTQISTAWALIFFCRMFN